MATLQAGYVPPVFITKIINKDIMPERSESNRLQRESWLQRMLRRPEIGSFVVMIVIILALAFASNGKAFNALGLKNNIAIVEDGSLIKY